MIGKEDLIRCHIASGDGESVATAYLFDSDYADRRCQLFGRNDLYLRKTNYL